MSEEKRVAEGITLLSRGESVMWLKISGCKVHVTVSGDGSHRSVLTQILNQLKK